MIYLLIHKEESLFVFCLFFMHLSIVRASAAKLSRNPLLNQEKVERYFFPKIRSPSSPLKDSLGFQPIEFQYSVFK